ncbi:unnamed protein product [Auanema sp. JU1783]|nr:unnamed protein product [Auanema sp. JU1783]
MFFSYEQLIKSDGQFSVAWLLSFFSKKTIPRSTALSCSVSQICEELIKRCPTRNSTFADVKKNFSLYLHGRLLYGATILMFKKQAMLEKDLETLYEKLRSHSWRRFLDTELNTSDSNNQMLESDMDFNAMVKSLDKNWLQLLDSDSIFELNSMDEREIPFDFLTNESITANAQTCSDISLLTDISGYLFNNAGPFQVSDFSDNLEDNNRNVYPNIDHYEAQPDALPPEYELSSFPKDSFQMPARLEPENKQASVLPQPEPVPAPHEECKQESEEEKHEPVPQEPEPVIAPAVAPVPSPGREYKQEAELELVLQDDFQLAPAHSLLDPAVQIQNSEQVFEESWQSLLNHAAEDRENKKRETFSDRMERRFRKKKQTFDETTKLSEDMILSNIETYADTLVDRKIVEPEKTYPTVDELLQLANPGWPKKLHYLFRAVPHKPMNREETKTLFNTFPVAGFFKEADESHYEEMFDDMSRTPGYTGIYEDSLYGNATPGRCDDLTAMSREGSEETEKVRRATRSSIFEPFAPADIELADDVFTESAQPGRFTFCIKGKVLEDRKNTYEIIRTEINDSEDGLMFSKLLPVSTTSYDIAAKYFGCLLDLLALKDIKAEQLEPYGEIILSKR